MFSVKLSEFHSTLRCLIHKSQVLEEFEKPHHTCTMSELNWECIVCDTFTKVNFCVKRNNCRIIYNRFYLSLIDQISDYIEGNEKINSAFAVLSKYFKMNDMIFLGYIAYKFSCVNLHDILSVKNIYHSEEHKIQFRQEGDNIFHTHIFDRMAIRILRVLVGLLVFVDVDIGHMKAIKYGLTIDSYNKFLLLIKKIFSDDEFLALLKEILLVKIKIHDRDFLVYCFNKFELDFNAIFPIYC
jgi:hypothetical protein